MILRKILELPVIYNTYQSLVGAETLRRKIFLQSIVIRPGMKILDIGCGTGELIRYLPQGIEYVGVDISNEYINFAKEQYKDSKNFEFFCADVNDESFYHRNFDVIIAIGLLHHLNDDEVKKLLSNINKYMAPSGTFYSLDPLLDKKQSFIERFIITRDRGGYVRFLNEYSLLYENTGFSSVQKSVRTDLLRIPFTHLFVAAIK